MSIDPQALAWLEAQATLPNSNAAKVLEWAKPHIQLERFNAAAHEAMQKSVDKANGKS
jgi:hypothetical protein